MSTDLQPWEGLSPEKLADYINGMILHDFTGLLNLLYRLDVSESKVRKILEEMQHEDAGRIIAGVIIERQLQKQQTKQQFRQDGSNIPEDEKW